jgi:nucleotide-binding universal stress UspA family protein
MAGEIVLGYDGSAGAKAALPQAVDLATAFGVPLVLAFAHGANPVGGVGGDLSRKSAEVGQRFLDEGAALARAADPSVEITGELVNAMPVEGLAGLAEQSSARMIVVGGNGRGPLIGTLLGSTGYKLLNQTLVPVLVVQPPD